MTPGGNPASLIMAATWRAVRGVFSDDLTVIGSGDDREWGARSSTQRSLRPPRKLLDFPKPTDDAVSASDRRSNLPDQHENGGVPGDDSARNAVRSEKTKF